MKFTPESLLQIYLDGSFTEEAQAEFDALMRKDPAFSEKVTQAVAERLGPVPEATLTSIASNLNARRNDLWAQHKPSPFLKSLKLAGQLALGVGAAALLWVGGRHAVEKFRASTAPVEGTSLAPAPQASTQSQAPGASLTLGNVAAPGSKKPSTARTLPGTSASKAYSSQAASGSKAPVPVGGSTAPSNSLPSLPKAAVPGKAPGASTAEGRSLRVAISTEKATQAVVTVFDSTGVLVRHLYQGPVDPGEHYLDWDGKSDQGLSVPAGDYNVVLDLGGKKMSGVLKILPQ